MANKKASKQDILINRRNRLRNTHFKSMMKTSLKKAEEAILNNSENVEVIVRKALRIFDKVAAKGIIHKKFAARKKSNLAKKLNTVKK